MMLSLPFTPRARFGALFAVLALGTGSGLVAGCGGGSDPVSDATVPSSVEATTPQGEVTTPAGTATSTTTTATSSAPGATAPTVTATTPASSTTQTTASTVPGGSVSTLPADPGGHAAPDENAATTTTTTTNAATPAQDPDCKPGTGPGQRYPQCEPLTGPDAQENEG
jgi:hypothetical protein